LSPLGIARAVPILVSVKSCANRCLGTWSWVLQWLAPGAFQGILLLSIRKQTRVSGPFVPGAIPAPRAPHEEVIFTWLWSVSPRTSRASRKRARKGSVWSQSAASEPYSVVATNASRIPPWMRKKTVRVPRPEDKKPRMGPIEVGVEL
jgi:hypothetical protein